MANEYSLHITSSAAQTVNGNDEYLFLLNNISGSDFWNNVKSDGGDLRLYHDSTDTRLPLDIQSIDSASQSGELYFHSTHSVSGSSTIYRLEWGDSSLTQPAVGSQYGRNDVWGDNSYLGIYHMGDDINFLTDSSGNGNTASPNSGNPSFTTGKIGDALDIDGSQNEFYQLNSGIDISYPITLEGWVNLDSLSGTQMVVARGNISSGGLSYALRIVIPSKGDTTVEYLFRNFSSTLIKVSGVITPSATTWHHVGATHRSDGTIDVYFDGQSVGTGNNSDLVDESVFETTVGADVNGAEAFSGLLDELRVANSSRTDGYFEEAYNNQNNNGSFWTVGPIQSLTTTVVPNDLQHNHTLDASNVSVNYSITTNDLSHNHTLDFTSLADDNFGSLDISSNSTLVVNGNSNHYFDLGNVTESVFWDNVKGDGGDLRLYHSASRTRIPIDLVYIDTGSETGELHFYSTHSQASTSTKYTLEFGDSNLVQPAVNEAYGRNEVWQEYEAVFHLNETGSVYVDSTGNGHTAQGINGVGNTTTNNPFGRTWADFTPSGGGDDYIKWAHSGSTDNEWINISYIMRINGTDNANCSVSDWNNATGQSNSWVYNAGDPSGNGIRVLWRDNGNVRTTPNSAGPATQTVYHQAMAVESSGSGGSRLADYLGGNLSSQNTYAADVRTINNSDEQYIGSYYDFAGRGWDGQMCEVKYYTGVRTDIDSYFEEENNSLLDNSNFWTVSNVNINQQTSLTANDLQHTHTLDNTEIVFPISVNDLLHNHTFDEATVVVDYSLTLNDLQHTHTLNAEVDVTYTLFPSESFYNQFFDNSAIDTNIGVTVNDSTFGHTIDATTVDVTYSYTADDLQYQHIVEDTFVTVDYLINPDNIFQFMTIDGTTVEPGLTAEDLTHNHTIDTTSIVDANILTDELQHTHTLDAQVGVNYSLSADELQYQNVIRDSFVTVEYHIAANDFIQFQTIDESEVATVIEPNDLTHNHLIGNTNILSDYTIVTDELQHNHTLPETFLTTNNLVDSNELQHNHTLDTSEIVDINLSVDSISHGHTIDAKLSYDDLNDKVLFIDSNVNFVYDGNDDYYYDFSQITQTEFWNNVSGDGSDIRVYHDSSNTRLPVDVVSFSSASETGEMHFYSTHSVSGSSERYRIEFGNESLEKEPDDSIYGRNEVWKDYGVVYHYSSLEDATGNGNDLAQSGSNVGKVGLLGKNYAQNGSDFIPTSSGVPIGNVGDDITISTWIRPDAFDQSDLRYLHWESHDGSEYYRVYLRNIVDDGSVIVQSFADGVGFQSTAGSLFWTYDPAGDVPVSQKAKFFVEDVYYKIDVVWDINNTLKIYANGQLRASKTVSGSIPVGTSGSLTIGNWSSGTTTFNNERKRLDETRISKKARSDNYIREEFRVQNNNDTFWTENTIIDTFQSLSANSLRHASSIDESEIITPVDAFDLQHSHSIDESNVEVNYTLELNDLQHGHTIDSPIIGDDNVFPNDISHNHTLNAEVDVKYSLTSDSLQHNHTIDAAEIIIDVFPDDLQHAHTIDETIVTVDYEIVPNELRHTHTMDAEVDVNYSLTSNDISHNHTLDNTEIVFPVNPNGLQHNHTIDNVDVDVNYDISSNELQHNHTLDNTEIRFPVFPNDMNHQHTIDNTNVGVNYSIITAELSHGHTIDEAGFEVIYGLGANELQHNHTIGEGLVDVQFALNALDAQHKHTINALFEVIYSYVADDLRHEHTIFGPINLAITAFPDNLTYGHTIDVTVVNVQPPTSLTLTEAEKYTITLNENSIYNITLSETEKNLHSSSTEKYSITLSENSLYTLDLTETE